MLSDQIVDLVGLVGLQGLLTEPLASLWNAVATLLVLGVAAIVVDYARMLRLRAQMVCSCFPPD